MSADDAQLSDRPWPTFPDPRSVVERTHIASLRDSLKNECPRCGVQALELLDETTFEARCANCGRCLTRYALADAALHDPEALERILEPYEGLWTLLAEEGRLP